MTCKCNDLAPQTTYPFDQQGNYIGPPENAKYVRRGVGNATSEPPTGSSTSSFLKGLAVGVLAGGALSALLYVGLQDEKQRRSTLSRRRRAGYAY